MTPYKPTDAISSASIPNAPSSDSAHFFFSSRRRHTISLRDWSSDVCSSDLAEPVEAVKGASLVAMLVPDLAQAELYKQVEKHLEKGATLLFAHGLNVHFKLIKPRKIGRASCRERVEGTDEE